MPAILEAVDLDDLFDDEDVIMGWIADSVQKGRVIKGYSGVYTHYKYGSLDLYSHIRKNDEDNELHVEGFDLQVSGPCVWTFHLSDVSLRRCDPFEMTRLVGIQGGKSGGFTIMHLINADVLPSFLEDDAVEAQVMAYALQVHYYKDEDALADTVPVTEDSKCEFLNGQKFLMGMGTIFPSGFMKGHIIKEGEEFAPDDSEDDLVVITGIVKNAYVKSVELNDEVISRFIATRIDTNFGELEIVHSRSMISDEEAAIIGEGVIIQAVAIVSGDVAIKEYEDGIVKDFENDLEALRYTLQKGNAMRLHDILHENIVYESVYHQNPIHGRDKVISHLDYVHDNTEKDYHAYLATITNTADEERCIVLTEGEDCTPTSLVSINVDEDGFITNVQITNDPGIRFKIDEKPCYNIP